MRRARIAAAVLGLVVLAGCRGEGSPGGETPIVARQSPAGLEMLPLTIRSGARSHVFTVEVAASEGQQTQGMMFRESLAPDHGMLFPFPFPRPASFWMKNTLIPLDMIFIRADGSIARILMNRSPGALEPMGVEEPVTAVLEIAGGRSTQLGINEGDRVSWPRGPTP